VTEAAWPGCDDPIAMVEFLRGSPTGTDPEARSNPRWRADDPQAPADRRFRRFACACCRRVWGHIPGPSSRAAVVAVEEYLGGRATPAALEAAFTASARVEYLEDGTKRPDPAYWAVKYLGRGFYKLSAGASALVVASRTLSLADEAYGGPVRSAFDGCFYAGAGVFLTPFRWPEPVPAAVRAERGVLAGVLRCLFGNPFRPAARSPAWRTSTCLALAEQMDRTGEFAPMPVLGDALEEAGCDNVDILSHCRGPGPHVRGCWVVDLVLGKT